MASSQSDEASGLHRLSEEQTQALEDTKAMKEKWQDFRSDYQTLRKKLETLPDKLTHDVMVPFGPLAFMPGKLVHSNEILVLLGDDWFAERSAKQACQIIDRRVKAIDDQMKSIEEQWKLLDSRKEFTSDFLQAAEAHGKLVEIKEDYDEEKERSWKEAHRRNVADERRSHPDEERSKTHDELMRRLDQLELMENEDDDDEDEISHDEDDDSEVSELMDEGESEENDESPVGPERVIRFSHTTIPQIGKGDGDTAEDAATRTGIQSPADIYKLVPAKSKSILKKTSSGESTNSASRVHFEDIPEPSVDEPSRSKSDVLAFSGQIKERDVAATSASASPSVSVKSVDQASEPQTTKRVSKFKQQRMQNQRR